MVGDMALFSVVYEYPLSLSSDDVDDDACEEDGLMAGDGICGEIGASGKTKKVNIRI
jgi:hypothetical protein